MGDWDDELSEGTFRRAVLEGLYGERRRAFRAGSENWLWIASVLLLGTNGLYVLAVFVNVIGGLGPATPSRIVWVAFGMDLVGVALLGWIFWESAEEIEGNPGAVRRIAALLLFLWVGLTVAWRFALPAALGTNIQELFTAFLTGPTDFPPRFRQDLSAM